MANELSGSTTLDRKNSPEGRTYEFVRVVGGQYEPAACADGADVFLDVINSLPYDFPPIKVARYGERRNSWPTTTVSGDCCARFTISLFDTPLAKAIRRARHQRHISALEAASFPTFEESTFFISLLQHSTHMFWLNAFLMKLCDTASDVGRFHLLSSLACVIWSWVISYSFLRKELNFKLFTSFNVCTIFLAQAEWPQFSPISDNWLKLVGG